MQEAMFVTSPYRPNHLQLKFYTIMQDSKRVLGFNCKKRIEQLNFFDWLWNVKNLVVWNGFELVRNVIQWDLHSFFFQKLTKIAQRLGALPPDPHSHRRLGVLPPDPRLWYVWVHLLTQHVFQVRLLHFSTISFRPLPLPKSWQSAIRLRLQILHSTISLPHKKLLFRKFLMTSLRVICGLGPPNQKSWLRLCFSTQLVCLISLFKFRIYFYN